MIKSIYNLVNAIIKDKLPDIKYFSLFRDQFNLEKISRTINYPAILLEVLPHKFQKMASERVQRSDITIKLHVGVQLFNSLDNDDILIDESVEFMEILDKIYDAFEGESSMNVYSGVTNSNILIGYFNRIEQNISVAHNSIYYGTIDFIFPIGVRPLDEDDSAIVTEVTLSQLFIDPE